LRLIVPYIGKLRDLDKRMIRLAEFLGVPFEALALAKGAEHTKFLERTVSEQGDCFVVNPEIMREWVGAEGISADLADFLLSRFTHLLVHGLRLDPFDRKLVIDLSRGKLKSVDAIKADAAVYEVAMDSGPICEAFSGLSFGPPNPVNDHVLSGGDDDPAVHSLISIGGRSFMAAVKLEGAEVFFVASEEVVDLNAEDGDAPLADYFSRLLPQAMALRHMAGEECWRPSKAFASIIIDDPILRERYGFLRFDSLLNLTNQHNFHTTLAFIPHNFKRNATRITSMFRENAAQLSICFHGNDHTKGEFASADPTLLNTLVSIAEDRMKLHYQITGLRCDRVMVFPQGKFSRAAMTVLKSHNFNAAVNTGPYSSGQSAPLTVGELAQPALLRYGGFPLFLRKPIRKTHSQDIAFNLFFGRPILIVEHHDIFQYPESLVEIAAKINSVAPEVRWSNLATVVEESVLTRRATDGTYHVRAYSSAIRISNESSSARRYSIEWNNFGDGASIEKVLMDGQPVGDFRVDDRTIQISVELAPGTSQEFAVVHRNDRNIIKNLNPRWNAQAFIRRRLSEFRDNYLSKNQHLLASAKAFQRRFLKV
jgi:hypothetical protein